MGWECEAYGRGGRAAGAVCFFSSTDRSCYDRDTCRTKLAAERARVFTRINELAVDGDADMEFLAEVFGTPDEILNAKD